MYSIHGTSLENTLTILEDGYIIPSKNPIMIDEPIKQIFTQIIYRDIPNESIQKSYWWSCAFILNKNILKDLPFYATHMGGFSDNFQDGMDNIKGNRLAYGKGNLQRMPILTKLKTHINKYMESEEEQDNVNFIHSHEILFNKKISIKKYCMGITIHTPTPVIYKKNNKEYKKIEKLADKYGLFVKYKHTGYGLNNFIDLIEE